MNSPWIVFRGGGCHSRLNDELVLLITRNPIGIPSGTNRTNMDRERERERDRKKKLGCSLLHPETLTLS